MLTSDELKRLNVKKPLRSLKDIALSWMIIIGALSLVKLSPYFIPLTMIIVATRLNGFIVFMHDGAHYLLTHNRTLNDVISNLFCSFPLMISTEVYRQTHFKHHQQTQTMKDPNYVIMQNNDTWHFPKPKKVVTKTLLKDFFLMTMKDHMIILKDWQIVPNYKKAGKLEQFLFPLYFVTMLTAVSIFHLWPEFLVLQASSLLLNPVARIRSMSEHVHAHAQGQSKMNKLQETTTINANWIERLFISPFNSCRHLEHHLYPTVPYYNLEKMHHIIKETSLYKAHCLYELDGYFLGKRTSLNEVLSSDSNEEMAKAA